MEVTSAPAACAPRIAWSSSFWLNEARRELPHSARILVMSYPFQVYEDWITLRCRQSGRSFNQSHARQRHAGEVLAGDIAASPEGIELARRLRFDDFKNLALGLDQDQDAILDTAQHVVKRQQSRAVRGGAMARHHHRVVVDHRQQPLHGLN